MGIQETMVRSCVQTAVYWGTPVKDGYGGFTFASPVEIPCRWEDRIGQFTSRGGEQIYTKATIYVLQDLDDSGYLFLGTLADISGEDDAGAPKDIVNAFEIKRFDKLPALMDTTKFVRKAYL